ncbi:MAG TPA: cysteine synthase A [Polyangiales bacterium]|nr:cysteine synthase A [Polyangiales bacterium]
MPIYDGVFELIGRTPLVRLKKLSPPGGAEVCGKLESRNPGGSVKDRPAREMVRAAFASGVLSAGATIVEATSGNTGISLAMLSAARGLRCVLVMPEDASVTRRLLLQSYGAELVLTPAEQGMAGAVAKAEAIAKETPGSFMCRQFDNPFNPAAHAATAHEIWTDTGGHVDGFVAGIGTGGTFTGVTRALKAQNPGLLAVAVEPRSSAVLGGGKPGLHGIPGLGAGFVPKVLDRSLIDQVIPVSDVAADRTARRLAHEEGLLVGLSSGANVYAAIELAKTMRADQRVVTMLCDTGERYLC